MGEALNVAQRAYEAFGRQDIPAFLNLVADEVDLEECRLRRVCRIAACGEIRLR